MLGRWKVRRLERVVLPQTSQTGTFAKGGHFVSVLPADGSCFQGASGPGKIIRTESTSPEPVAELLKCGAGLSPVAIRQNTVTYPIRQIPAVFCKS